MKTIYSLIIMCLMGINLNGQDTYAEAMQKGLGDFENIETLDDFVAIANHFERISEVESNAWLPFYYASYIYCILAFKTSEVAIKEVYIEKAQSGLDKAMEISPKESELHTLQGMLYQAYIGIDPMQNGQVYSGKAAASFGNALEYNPKNPRPIYLQAISIMHTPEQYGGGKKAACPLFQQAQQLFESFEPVGEFAPDWGKDDCTNYLSGCNEVAEK